ncbi:ATP-dependent DNA helicase yku80 [Malassezia yamatoensis]|uniref:ATP-dependent DNA helicase II subunit 2 n=1 Tax=Malassezia yamatoensis TaxID=253288 RepID=A0AAJ6CHS7_9BASI|nr:ATP-dependent DNA helicase yku80 [Malassezia yamatoensis]
MLRKLSTIKVCLIAYGSETTNNIVRRNGVQEGYEGVDEIWPPSRPTLETLELLSALRPAQKKTLCDPLDALITAIVTMMQKNYGEPSDSWTRVIYLITRADTLLNTADVEMIQERLLQDNIQLRIMGFDFPVHPMKSTKAEIETSISSFNTMFWRSMLESQPHAVFAHAEDAEEQALMPSTQLAKSAPTNLRLTFGHTEDESLRAMSIPVQLLKATAIQRPMTQRKIRKTQQHPVEARREYYKVQEVLQAEEDLDQLQPLPEECHGSFQRAFKLGASLIPMHDAMEQPLDTKQGIEILHFVHASSYRREYHLGETSMVIANPKSPHAQIALSSLAQAADEKGVYLLCRLVSRPNLDPKLYILAPDLDQNQDAFIMTRVPFREDVKRFAFAPLDRVPTKEGGDLRVHPTIPTSEQQDAMDQLVDSMSLMDADPDQDPEGWYAPSLSFNPAIHNIKNAVKWRFLSPENHDLPELHPKLTQFLTTPVQVEKRARTVRDNSANLFATRKPQQPKKVSDEPRKKIRQDSDSDVTPDEDERDALPKDAKQVSVHGGGNIRISQPVEDFEMYVYDTEQISEACEAMTQVLFLLTEQNPADYALIVRSLHSFRAAATELSAVGPPNMTPAQLAMRQKMLAFQARRMGVANPAAGQQKQSGVRRGPQIKLALWRSGQNLSQIWEVDVVLPKDILGDAPTECPELVRVSQLCWSPDGGRLAVRISVSRNDIHCSAILLYRVDDGKKLSTQILPSQAEAKASMHWIKIDAPVVKSQALRMLNHLAPLPTLAVVGQPTGAHSRAAGAKSVGNQDLPSSKIALGEEVLAKIPALPQLHGNDSKEPISLLYVTDDGRDLHAFLDGTLWIGACQISQAQDGVIINAPSLSHVSTLVDDGNQLCLCDCQLALCETLPAVVHLAKLSTAVQSELAQAMDAIACASQAWQKLARPRALEWQNHLHDLSKRYAVDLGIELMALVMTGRGGPASEQLLLHNLTEGVNLDEIISEVQTCLALARALQEQSEQEMLAIDEYFKWWRTEQDRQERIKIEGVVRVIPTHDTMTVAELLRRGFLSPELDALLGTPKSSKLSADTSIDEDASQNTIESQQATAQFAGAHEPAATPTSIESCVAAALHYLESPPGPSYGNVYEVPQLFIPPEHAFNGPRSLPGDAMTLEKRLHSLTERIASLFSTSLGRSLLHASTSIIHSVSSRPYQRDDSQLSAPSDISNEQLCSMFVRTSKHYTAVYDQNQELCLIRADGAVAKLDIPHMIDFAFQNETHLVVLHGETCYEFGKISLKSVSFSKEPNKTPIVWQKSMTCAWEQGTPARIAVHGPTCVVLGDDHQTMMCMEWTE